MIILNNTTHGRWEMEVGATCTPCLIGVSTTHRKSIRKSNDEQATMTAMNVARKNANNSCTGPSSLASDAKSPTAPPSFATRLVFGGQVHVARVFSEGNPRQTQGVAAQVHGVFHQHGDGHGPHAPRHRGNERALGRHLRAKRP